MQYKRRSILATCLLSASALVACPGETTAPRGDGGPELCAASVASGLYMVPFGPVYQELIAGHEVALTVIVARGSSKEGEGKTEPGQTVTFRILTPKAGVSLDRGDAVSDKDGVASVKFKADAKVLGDTFQIEATLSGACAQTFTVDVREPLRQLRAVTPIPFDTFTNSRVPLAVEATTNNNAKLAGEEISFRITLGKSGATKLSTSAGGSGDTLTVKTSSNGRATVLITTGPSPIPQLKVEATMNGTAPVTLELRVAKGTGGGCKTLVDCPLGYTCKSGICEPPPTLPPSGCATNADCVKPMICQKLTGQCLTGTGKSCDPIEGTGCSADEVCVGGQCAKIPSACKDTSQCPATWICKGGSCVPSGQPPTNGCKVPKDCPTNQTCINGSCRSKTACNIVHKKDRLKGQWRYDSTLHLRQSLNGLTSGILKVSGYLRDIIQGNFKISGIPGFISKIVSKYLKKLIGQYIPPWGQQMIVALGNINDIVDDMRILATVQKTPAGPDAYLINERWELIEFDYQGKKISSPPSAIPEIGAVNVRNYLAHEVCGVLFIDRHRIQNKVGGLIKWAIQTALSVTTCNTSNVPCFNSIEQALTQTINCQALGGQIDALVRSVWSGAPSVAGLVAGACISQKDKLIKTLVAELNALTVKMSLLQLSGTALIPNPGQDNKLQNGKWNGVLGSGILKGNFHGEFKASR